MGLPSGVTTCEVTLGPVIDAAGNVATLTASVQAVLPTGLQHIIWTGDSAQEQLRSAKSPVPNGTDDPTTCVIDLPVVDQSGWETPGDDSTPPAAITGWYYLLAGTATWATKEKHLFQIPFQPLTGMTALALNPFKQTEEGAVVSDGFTAPTGFVSTVAGLSGHVSAADLAAALDTAADTEIASDLIDLTTPVGSAAAANGLAMSYAIGG